MTIRNGVCFFLLFFLLSVSGYAQPKYKIEHYSTEQGLSHRRINCMIKDREGFMWLGTWNGINRFDGHSFVSFKPAAANTHKLGNSRIAHIMEDQARHLWIQAYDYQIYRFDKKTETFLPLSAIVAPDGRNPVEYNNILYAADGWVWLQTKNAGIFCVAQTAFSKDRVFHYTRNAAAACRLPSDTIHFFYADKERRIWVGTGDGLACLERSATGIYTNNNRVPPGMAAGTSFTAHAESAGQLYFGTAAGDLVVYDKRSGKFSNCHLTAGSVNALLCSGKGSVLYASTSQGEILTVSLTGLKIGTAVYRAQENLSALYEDYSGGLWIEPEKTGAIRFDPLKHTFQLFLPHSGKVPDTDMNSRYFWLQEDAEGTVWVNMKGGGLALFTPADNSWKYAVQTPDGAGYQLPDNVTVRYYDTNGILWLTTNQGGVVKVVIQDDHFQQHLLAKEGAAENEVRGMFCDSHNRLWMGVKRGGLVVTQYGLPVKGLFVNEPAGGLVGVYTILQDRRGNIWMGTKDNGLFRASPVNVEQTQFRLTHFSTHKDLPDSLPCNQVRCLLEDKNGRIWIGSLDNGLVLTAEEKDEVKFIHIPVAGSNAAGISQNIRHMCLDKAGNIWVATTNGLLVLDGNVQQGPIQQYKAYGAVAGDAGSLGDNDILFICRDRNNRMWLTTAGGGFCEATGNEPLRALRFRSYTMADGMPNDYVLSCTEDASGHLWLATDNGLSRFNPETLVFRNFDSHDGLPLQAAFSEASVAGTKTGGQLFFGTTTGYLSFDPARINASPVTANIVFTALEINNREVAPASDSRLLKADVNYVPELTLPYNQNSISINYAILDYRASGRQQGFAYRLADFDTSWHTDWQFHKATYTNLPPGHYIFEVKALSADLYCNQPCKRIAVIIRPPWWKTGWAYLFYVILGSVLVYTVWRYTLAMMRLRNKVEVEQKLAALKMNFFTNVSHELRTPLTLIVGPLEQLAQKAQLSPELTAYVSVARKNAVRMVRFVNQLLDLRKVQHSKDSLHLSQVELVGFVTRISEYFTEAFQAKQIQLSVVSEEKELFVYADAEKLDVVLYNLIGNAVKFTPEGKQITLLIRSLAGEQSFSIAVQDQGSGVPADKLDTIFELFHEGDNGKGNALKGTGIGLALSREFVQLHGGKIWAENNADGGLTVTLQLKNGNEAPVAAYRAAVAPAGQFVPDELVPDSAAQHPDAALVLLVEDNAELRAFIKAQLSAHYRVETAGDGEEGWQKAIQLVPDLIVSDIMMPRIDGIQLLDKIKNEERTSHIPVVLLSARHSIESQIEGLSYGADAYITKPFHSEFLIASVNNLLLQRKKLFEGLMERKKKLEVNPETLVITSKDEVFLQNLIQLVEAKIDDPDFNIDSIAETMALSRTNFYKKFKSLTTLTPLEFVRDMRLQRARQYLDAGEHNISEVAYLTGFSNPKYFSTCFREKYQVSPSDYVKGRKG